LTDASAHLPNRTVFVLPVRSCFQEERSAGAPIHFQSEARSPRLGIVSVDVAVAIGAERDQIFLHVVTQLASGANVVDLKTIGTAAVLASPAVTL
jgi:hypothetical protein